MLPRGNYPYGRTRSKSSQSSAPAGLKAASDFGFWFQCQAGSSLVLHRPSEITRVTGHLVLARFHVYGKGVNKALRSQIHQCCNPRRILIGESSRYGPFRLLVIIISAVLVSGPLCNGGLMSPVQRAQASVCNALNLSLLLIVFGLSLCFGRAARADSWSVDDFRSGGVGRLYQCGRYVVAERLRHGLRLDRRSFRDRNREPRIPC